MATASTLNTLPNGLNVEKAFVSDDGTRIFAMNFTTSPTTYYYYTSSNGGSSWTQQLTPTYITTAFSHRDMAMSSTGQYVILVGLDGSTWKALLSSDYGATWTTKVSTTDSALAWNRVEMSANGQVIVAGLGNGYFTVSKDYGTNWTQRNITLGDFVISPDGQALLDVNGLLFRGSDLTTATSQSFPVTAWFNSPSYAESIALSNVAAYAGGTYQSAVGMPLEPKHLRMAFGSGWVLYSAPGMYSSGVMPSADDTRIISEAYYSVGNANNGLYYSTNQDSTRKQFFSGTNPNIYNTGNGINGRISSNGLRWNVGRLTGTFSALITVAPTISLTSKTDTTITVSWTGISCASYNIYRNGSYVTNIGSASTSYSYSVSPNTSYTLFIKGVNSDGDEGPSSNVLTVVSHASQASGVNSSATGTGTATISWTNGSAQSYKIYASDGITLLGTATISPANLTGLTTNTLYTNCTVRAVNSEGTTNNTSCPTIPSFTTWAQQPTIAGSTTSRITGATVSWTLSQSSSYNIYYGTTLLGSCNSTTNSFNVIDGTLPSNSNISNIKVRAVNVSSIENTVGELVIPAFWTYPSAPTNFIVSGVTTNGCTLSWTAPSGTITEYNVFNDTTQIATTASTNVVLSTLSSNTLYNNLSVKAYNANSGYVSAASATNQAFYTIPSQPLAPYSDTRTTSGCRLLWASPGGNGALTYDVYKNGVPLAANVATTETMVSGLEANTHYAFTIVAKGPDGGCSSMSPEGDVLTVPNAPTNVHQTSITATTITLEWTPPTGDGALTYLLFKDGFIVQSNIPSNTTTISGLDANNIYSFHVLAKNTTDEDESGRSVASASFDGLTLPPPPSLAPSVNNLSASTPDSLTLSWDAVGGEGVIRHYNVFVNGSLAQSDITTLSTEFSGLTSNTSYSFAIQSTNDSGDSDLSIATNVLTYPFFSAPISISSVAKNSALLEWLPPDPENTGGLTYSVFQNGEQIASELTALSKLLTGLSANSTYNLSIIATNATGDSLPSTASVLTVSEGPIALHSVNATPSSLQLLWTAPAGDGALTYKINQDGNTIIEDLTTTEFYVDSLAPNTTYTYQVFAHNNSGDSDAALLSATTTTLPPTGLIYTAITTSTCDLSWTPTSGAMSYKILQLPESAQLATIDINNYQVTGLTPNTNYSFGIKAVNAGGNSPSSLPLDILTYCATPVSPTSIIGANSVKLQWEAPLSGAAYYKIKVDGNLVPAIITEI